MIAYQAPAATLIVISHGAAAYRFGHLRLSASAGRAPHRLWNTVSVSVPRRRLSSLDSTISPCLDPYGAACRGWRGQRPTAATRSTSVREPIADDAERSPVWMSIDRPSQVSYHRGEGEVRSAAFS